MEERIGNVKKEREKTNNVDGFFILKTLIRELGLILVLASIFWLMKDGDFIMCCRKSAFLMSLAFICHLGIEVFWALDTNRWRIKLANEEYQVYKAIILMILNAVVLSLTGPNGSIYPIIIVPIILWGMMIMIRRIRRWFRS